MPFKLLHQREEWDHDLSARNLLADLGMEQGLPSLDTLE